MTTHSEQKSQEKIRREGQVIEALPNATFKINMDNGDEVLAHLSGRLRMNYIRVLVGDRVIIEFSPYDEKKGRIVRRL
jgi:translation initiation factor IF-1